MNFANVPKENIIIWLDDLRDPIEYGVPDAVWCKSAKDLWDLYQWLILTGRINEVVDIHFDNDLGIGYDGYYCFTRLETLLHAAHSRSFKKLKNIFVHTSNPSAAKKFMVAKESFKVCFDIDIIRMNH